MSVSVDHVGISVTDYEAAKIFYAAALKPLGMTIMMDYGVTVGLGAEFPFLWISKGNPGHVHLALRAPDRQTVDAFHGAALAAGGKDNGAPGPRSQYHENYYGAFILDADGHNIEAVCHAPG